MRKEDFKTVKGVTLISNLSTSMMFCWLSTVVYWLISLSKDKNGAALYFMLGFLILFICCSLLNIVAAQKITNIKFKGTAKNMKDNAIKESKIFIFPILFTISMNRIRKAMWDFYISHKMENIDGAVSRTKASLELLEELHEDGYIPQMEYDKRKGNLEEALLEAVDMEKKEKKEKVKAKKSKTSEEPWI